METVYTLEQKVKSMLAHVAALHQENARLVALFEGLKEKFEREQQLHAQHLEVCSQYTHATHEHERHIALCTQTLDTLIADIDRLIATAPLVSQAEKQEYPQAHPATTVEAASPVVSSSLN